jgi:hypothetical protein
LVRKANLTNHNIQHNIHRIIANIKKERHEHTNDSCLNPPSSQIATTVSRWRSDIISMIGKGVSVINRERIEETPTHDAVGYRILSEDTEIDPSPIVLHDENNITTIDKGIDLARFSSAIPLCKQIMAQHNGLLPARFHELGFENAQGTSNGSNFDA